MEAAAGARLPGPLVLPTGFAALVALAQLLTWKAAVAPATAVVVAVAAAVGLLWRARTVLRRGVDVWAAATGAGVYVAFLAPILFSGVVGFAGYVLLGDTAIHLELADRIVHHGSTTEGLIPSSYAVSLWSYFFNSYPTGTHAALGALGQYVGIDLAWTYQPFLAWMSGLGALAIYELVRPVIAGRPLRAAVAFVGAQPGLVYAFAMQGSIKELGTITTLICVFALLPWVLAHADRWRIAIPAAVASAGAVGAIDVAAGVWIAPLLAGMAIALAWRLGPRAPRVLAAQVAAFALVGGVLVLPALTGLNSFVQGTQKVLTSSVEYGDLLRPLDGLQVFGVWPRGDFRLALETPGPYLLIGLVIAGVVLGTLWMLRGRAPAAFAFAAVSAFAWWWITRTGSPWADAKALTILSVPVLVVALLGAVSLAAARRRVEAGLLLAAIAAGVLWTNALAYHDVQLSNHDRLAELEDIGHEIAGRGPTFTPEFEEFAKYFLRAAAPVGGSEPLKPAASVMVPDAGLRFGFSTELGQFAASYLRTFRTLVVRRAPVQSRPPAGFVLTRRGTYYDVWTRSEHPPAILGELPLGDRYQRGAPAPCAEVAALADQAADGGGALAWAPAPRLVVASPAHSVHTPNWVTDPGDPDTLRAQGPGRVTMRVHVPRAGRYDIWVEASLNRPLRFSIDGRYVGTAPKGLSPRGPGEDVRVGSAVLSAGSHRIRIERGGGGPDPGNGGTTTLMGPTTLAPAGWERRPVLRVPAARWHSLCGRMTDWVEAVR